MTKEILERGWELQNAVERAKSDLEHLQKVEFIHPHGCTRVKKKDEEDDEATLKETVRAFLTARLLRLEKQFKKL